MTTARIVVGVDGSEASQHALRWALSEARVRGTGVEAVHVWRYPVWTYSPAITTPPAFAREDLEAEAQAVLDHAVDAALETQPGDIRVDRMVAEGVASEQLVRLAAGADLLVVGHRGRGGFATLLLGSVAHQCAAHATCPVVIVR